MALGGIWWMVHDGVSAQGLSGMLIALGVPIAAAINLVVLKKMHAQVNLAPAVLIGAVLSCLLTLPLAWPLTATGNDLAILALLGLVQLALPCMLMVRVARSPGPARDRADLPARSGAGADLGLAGRRRGDERRDDPGRAAGARRARGQRTAGLAHAADGRGETRGSGAMRPEAVAR